MKLEIVKTCPLGHTCESIVDGKIHQCAWLVKLAGQNPQTGEVIDETGCAMQWVPILLVENSKANKTTSDAVISLREETIMRQDAAIARMSSTNLIESK